MEIKAGDLVKFEGGSGVYVEERGDKHKVLTYGDLGPTFEFVYTVQSTGTIPNKRLQLLYDHDR